MSNSARLRIPFVPQGTLDPAAGLNEAIRFLDALVQCRVISMALTVPPVSNADGDLYVVASPATGDWAGQELNLAKYVLEGDFWEFFVAGDQVNALINRADGNLYTFDDSTSPGTWVFAVSAATLLIEDENSPPTMVSGAQNIIVGDGLQLESLTGDTARLSAAGVSSVQDGDSPPTIVVAPAASIVFGDGLTLTDLGGGVARVDAVGGGGGGGGMTLLGSDIVVGSPAATLDVSSISSAFDHLMIVFLGRCDSAGVNNRELLIRMNNDSGANYDYQDAHFVDSASGLAQAVAQTAGKFASGIPAATATANRPLSATGHIPNYTNTTFDKQGHSESGSCVGTAGFNIIAGIFSFNWRPATPAAINRITLLCNAGNFVVGSGLWIYGY